MENKWSIWHSLSLSPQVPQEGLEDLRVAQHLRVAEFGSRVV